MLRQPLNPTPLLSKFDGSALADRKWRGRDFAVISATLTGWCTISAQIDSVWGILAVGLLATVFSVAVILILGLRNTENKEEGSSPQDEPGKEPIGEGQSASA